MQATSRFLKLIHSLQDKIKHIQAEQLFTLLNHPELKIIDVRESSEFAQGHLPNAIHLSKGILERDIEKLIPDPHTPIVVYCSGGFRSILAAYNLQQMGYDHVQSLQDGAKYWLSQNLPWVSHS